MSAAGRPRAFVTRRIPHVASGTRATRGAMVEMAAANLLAGLAGQPLPDPVNPEVYRA